MARVTKDLDLCPAWSAENLERVAAALRDLAARMKIGEGSIELLEVALDAKTLANMEIVPWRTQAGSPVERPRRYRIGITSPTFGDRRAYAGRIRELNFCRSPVSSSTRLSFTRGARTRIVPDPTVTRRSRARPLRTTTRCPSSSISSS
jgi:hypothetical protein